METEEESSGSEEAAAPSELAQSLKAHRPALQRIRRRLHGNGNAGGITSRLAALLLWISTQMAHTRFELEDPVFFLADLGEGEGGGRNKLEGSRKAKRESLASFQGPTLSPRSTEFERGGERTA
jgi:hypothetical protein